VTLSSDGLRLSLCWGALIGFGLAHLRQNLPPFSAPQTQVQLFITGFGLPHSEQNFPVLPLCPRGQTQAGCGLLHSVQNLPSFFALQSQIQLVTGFGFPHSEQNFPVFSLCLQERVQAAILFCVSLYLPNVFMASSRLSSNREARTAILFLPMASKLR